jgi:hypothetical protein
MIDIFDIFRKLADDNNKDFKAYTGQTKLNGAEIDGGQREGWGSISLAVDSGTVQQICDDDNVTCILLVYKVSDVLEAQKELLEKEENKN